MENYSNSDNSEIQKNLNKIDKNKIKSLERIKFKFYFDLINKCENNKNNSCFSAPDLLIEIKDNDPENNIDKISKNIIYGDYKHKNQEVEVFLHQRTMKQIKYKKREFSKIHSIDLDKLEKINNKLKDFYKNNKIINDLNFTFDLTYANKNSLKQILNNFKNISI